MDKKSVKETTPLPWIQHYFSPIIINSISMKVFYPFQCDIFFNKSNQTIIKKYLVINVFLYMYYGRYYKLIYINIYTYTHSRRDMQSDITIWVHDV